MEAEQGAGGVIVTVTPNPAWDVTYPVDELRVGESIRVRAPLGRAGGKGINVARVICALGGQALAVAPVGGSRGQLFADSLAADEVPARLVPVPGEVRQSVAVVPELAATPSGVSQRAEPTVFNEAGEQLGQDSWAALTLALREVVADSRPQTVVISGSMPPGTSEEQLRSLVEAGRAEGARVLVDTSGEALIWAARAGSDLVKPNRTEAMDATGEDGVEGAAAALRRLGAGAVVITDGGNGMTAFDGDAVWRARPAEAVSGNPTGAGDAALAALALSWDQPWPARLRHAIAASAAAVAEPVAGQVNPAAVAAYESSIDVEEM